MKELENKENSCFICTVSLSASVSFFSENGQICIDEWKILFLHLIERDSVAKLFFFQNLVTEFLKHVRENWNTRNSREGACVCERERALHKQTLQRALIKPTCSCSRKGVDVGREQVLSKCFPVVHIL